ncbi:MAG: hypothetical protein GC185_09345 [Alphaproteobacteria bacterium]|nr:hypothetical protein [Alphaproteobacteria bacterium]
MKLGITRTPEDDAAGPALDLGKAIAEFYKDFPEHRKDVFILNHQQFETGKEAVASIAPALDKVKEDNPAASLGMSKSMALGMFEGKLPCSVSVSDSPFSNKPDMQIYARIVIPAGEEFTARVMKSIFVSDDPIPNTQYPVMKDEYNNTEMWQRYVLDHELGHAVTMMEEDARRGKSISVVNHRECEADAYSMIRHYQRYGEDSTFPEYIRDIRNMNAVQKGDVAHWTSRALDEVIALNKKGALKNLSPAEARDLAVEIAARQGLSADAEHNMQQALSATVRVTMLAKKNKTPDGDKVMDYMMTVAKTGAETESPAVLDCCKRYMDSIRNYLPAEDLPMTKTPDQLREMKANVRIMKDSAPKREPEMTGLKRIFRDAAIDARTGGAAPKNDNGGAAPKNDTGGAAPKADNDNSKKPAAKKPAPPKLPPRKKDGGGQSFDL